MSFEEVRALSGIAGLLFFLVFFLGVLAWTFRPGSRRKFEDASRIPLKED